ncbi:hypothetical protein B7P43_G00699 [Cryptotermes secundus]|uniref:Uncharacterized protein n=1 Tax=Cryptotermes secundus TaxID=105785 RepID=A0A2J7RS50_9NEOP|nr:hypothetical protein B7P43_G00699 [Cryptotermes secundus]
MHTITEEMWEALFSVSLYLENLNTSQAEFKLGARQFETEIVAPGEGAPTIVSHCIEMLSLAVRQTPACEDVSPEAENVHSWKTLPSSVVKTLSGNTRLDVTVICEL